MAWNGSGEGASNGSPRKAGNNATASHLNVKGLIALAVLGLIAVVGIITYFLLGNDANQVQASSIETKSGALADVGTNIAVAAQQPTAVVAKAPKEKTPEEKRLEEIKYFEDRYGTNMTPGIKAHVYFLKHPPQVYHPKTEYGFLRHPAERQIASLLFVEPGTFMLSKPEYGESFNKDFLNSVLDKTEILDTDDEGTRAVKQAVDEARQTMLSLRDSEGKLPNEILNEHAAILYELGRYEQDLENELNAVKNDPSVTDQEVEDLFAAANKLRQSKGLPEWKIPDFSKRTIRLQKKLSRKANH